MTEYAPAKTKQYPSVHPSGCICITVIKKSIKNLSYRYTLLATRRIFAFTLALCLGETLVLLDVVSQGLFGMLKMQGYYLCM